MLLNNVSFCLQCSGRLSEAVDGVRASENINADFKRWNDAAVATMNLSEILLALGNISDAVNAGARAVEYADRSEIPYFGTRMRATLADALHNQGNGSAALEHFLKAEEILRKDDPDHPYLYSLSGARYFDLLLRQAERAAWICLISPFEEISSRSDLLATCNDIAGKMNVILRWRGSNDPLIEIAFDALTLGRGALYSIMLDEHIAAARDVAKTGLKAALECFQRSGQQQEIPRGLLSHALLRFMEQDTDGAKFDLNQAWDMAERGPMRLHMADVHLHRARLFYRENPYPWKSPRDDLAAAERLINDCGYHRRDEELADAKRMILSS